MFKTSGFINKEFYNKYALIIYYNYIKTHIILLLILIAFLTILALQYENLFLFYMIMSVISSFLIFIIVFFSIKRSTNLAFNRNIEISGDSGYLLTSLFKDGTVIVKNNSINNVVKLNYDNFIKIKKAKNVYFLFTKANLFVPIFIENFSDIQKKEFLLFLKENFKNIKNL